MAKRWNRKTFKSIASSLSAAASLLYLAGCANNFEPKPNLVSLATDPHATGGRTADGKTLSAASNDGEIQAMKERITIADPGNAALAVAIIDSKVEPIDDNGKPTSGTPTRLRVRIRLQQKYIFQQQLDFEGALQPGTAGLPIFKNVRAKQDGFWLNAACRDADCRKVIMVLRHIPMKSAGQDSRPAEAGLIFRVRAASVKSLGDPQGHTQANLTNRLKTIRSTFAKPQTAVVHTTEVAWGLSTFELHLEDAIARLCVSGPLVATGDDQANLPLGCSGATTPEQNGIVATLIGNDNAGSIIFRLQDGSSSLYLSATVSSMKARNRPGTGRPNSGSDATGTDDDSDDDQEDEVEPSPLPSPTKPQLPPLGKGGIRIPFDPENPITQAWEGDRARKKVVAAINLWRTQEVTRMQQFLARIQVNLPVLTTALGKHNVPSEFMAITLIESKFFTTRDYPIEVAPTSTATGPWQFIEKTAMGLGLHVRPFKRIGAKQRRADPCDERALLGPSSDAAGKYFRQLINMFPVDPRLAIMSYYWGQGNVDSTIDRMSEDIKAAGVDFWTMQRFHMARASAKRAVAYTIKFIAAQFVGRNPELYGISPPDPQSIGAVEPAPTSCR